MVYDVAVVGAGSNGLTAAYFIAKKGFKTVILERGRIAGEKCQGPTEFPAIGRFKRDPPLYELMSSVLKEVPHIRNDWEVGTYIFYIDKKNKTRFKYFHDNPGSEDREVYSVHEPVFLKVMADRGGLWEEPAEQAAQALLDNLMVLVKGEPVPQIAEKPISAQETSQDTETTEPDKGKPISDAADDDVQEDEQENRSAEADKGSSAGGIVDVSSSSDGE